MKTPPSCEGSTLISPSTPAAIHPDDRVRVALVGTANFGAYRRKRMRESGLFDLVAAYDWNPGALAACQREEGALSVGSYRELLEVPGIEAVVISTGARYHAEQAVQAMERGLHVFVEKPLCTSYEEVRLLLETERRTGCKVSVGHFDHDCDPMSRAIKRLIDEGELGTITAFEKTTAHSGGLRITAGDWRGDPQRNPGGMLFQCGVHGLHELMFYFGPVAAVSAMMRYDVHVTRTADSALCLLHFASGVTGTLNAYHVTPYRHTLSLYGTRANLYYNNRYFEEGISLMMQKRSDSNGFEPLEPVSWSGPSATWSNLENFYHAIRHGGECSPSLRDGALAVQVVFAAERSAATGRTVAVEPLS